MFLVVLFVSFVVEIIVTAYTIAVAHGRLWLATISSGLVTLLNSIIVLQYIADPTMIFAAVIGQTIGTGLTMYGFSKLRK